MFLVWCHQDFFFFFFLNSFTTKLTICFQRTTPPHSIHTLSFPPCTVSPHRCAEGMERMCCRVGLRFAWSFSSPVLPWLQQRRLQLQSPLNPLLNNPTLWHTSFCFSPRTCGMPFPKTAYQQTVRHQRTKLIFFPQCFFFNRLHGSVYTCLYTWSDCL